MSMQEQVKRTSLKYALVMEHDKRSGHSEEMRKVSTRAFVEMVQLLHWKSLEELEEHLGHKVELILNLNADEALIAARKARRWILDHWNQI